MDDTTPLADDSRDELAQRLRALADVRVDPAVASRHLTAMTATPRPARWRTKIAIAGAFLAGLMVGGTGLATAGALPGPAQDAVASVLRPLGMPVEFADHCKGRPPWAGPPPWAGEDREPTETEIEARANVRIAWRAECRPGGRPEGAGGGRPDGPRGARGQGVRPFADDPCKGPPPWAGSPPEGATDEERAANREAQVRAHEAARAACPAGDVEPEGS